MDIVWKDTQNDPSENFTKLSQFAGAYASVRIDKATEVRQLVREKEERIQQLAEERQSIDQQVKAQLSQLQQSFDQLKLQHQAETSTKDAQI